MITEGAITGFTRRFGAGIYRNLSGRWRPERTGPGGLVPSLSSLVWALILGAVVANVLPLPAATGRGVTFAAKPILKVGVALLGFRISISGALDLVPKVLPVVLITLPVTFGAAMMVGRWLRLPSKLSLLTGRAAPSAARRR